MEKFSLHNFNFLEQSVGPSYTQIILPHSGKYFSLLIFFFFFEGGNNFLPTLFFINSFGNRYLLNVGHLGSILQFYSFDFVYHYFCFIFLFFSKRFPWLYVLTLSLDFYLGIIFHFQDTFLFHIIPIFMES